jgi:hypothetical protein
MPGACVEIDAASHWRRASALWGWRSGSGGSGIDVHSPAIEGMAGELLMET